MDELKGQIEELKALLQNPDLALGELCTENSLARQVIVDSCRHGLHGEKHAGRSTPSGGHLLSVATS